jgi:hydrogenase maturation protein HypF
MKTSMGLMAAKFHNTLVAVIVEVCRRLRETDGFNLVCLGGGTFQNAYLLEQLVPGLRDRGFEVYFNGKVPINDGGIAFGQAAVANAILRQGG